MFNLALLTGTSGSTQREKMAKTVEKFGEAKRFQMTLENCNYAVELGKKMNLVLVGIGGKVTMSRYLFSYALSIPQATTSWTVTRC